MAKGRKTGGRDFQPGQVTNPLGGGAHNKALKSVRTLTREEVAQVGALILENNLEALKSIRDDQNASVLKVWFASVAVKAISKGDPVALNVILNRIIGRVPEDIRLANPDGTLFRPAVIVLPSNGRESNANATERDQAATGSTDPIPHDNG